MNPLLTRRQALKSVACGFGYLALAGLTNSRAAAANPLAARPGHHPAKAKRCIFLFMTGGPSQVDLFDYKAELPCRHGQTRAGADPKAIEALLKEDIETMVGMGREQVRDGSHVLDVCTAYVGRDEVRDMTGVVTRYRSDVPVPLMVDSTFTTPWLMKPFDFGADLLFHSAAKFLSGHGTVIGGVLVDSGNFDWDRANAASGRFAELTAPYEGFHGMVFSEESTVGATCPFPAVLTEQPRCSNGSGRDRTPISPSPVTSRGGSSTVPR